MNDIIEIQISESQKREAKKKAAEMGTLKNSILHGEGNVSGFLGEIILRDYIGAEHENTYDYDLKIDSIKVDVKTTQCSSAPDPEYMCAIAAYNTKQRCDVYAFVRILRDHSTGWLLGWMETKRFYEMATLHKKDEIDPANGWKCSADCYRIKIGMLNKFKRKT